MYEKQENGEGVEEEEEEEWLFIRRSLQYTQIESTRARWIGNSLGTVDLASLSLLITF